MLRNGDFRRLAPRLVAAALVLFAILYVLVLSNPPPADGSFGDWRTTTYGSAVDDPGSFLLILLDAVTFAGLLFIVASGFSLIFGLMRVVNMAHGSFYLLAGYIAYEVQQKMTGVGGFAIAGADVSTWEWVLPVLDRRRDRLRGRGRRPADACSAGTRARISARRCSRSRSR